jgi:hypothetical protein
MAGTKEKLAGKAMQWEGKATGDPIRETEGRALSTFGRMKDRKAVTVAIAFGVIMTAIAVAAEWRERARPEAGSGPR